MYETIQARASVRNANIDWITTNYDSITMHVLKVRHIDINTSRITVITDCTEAIAK